MGKKSIFDYLHPNRTDSKKAESIEQIAAISHSCDAVGWRPVPYKIPEEYSDFIENLDHDVLDFISQAKPDMYNAEFYEETIDGNVARAFKALHIQQIEHRRGIHNIRIYQDASLADLKGYLARLEAAYKRKESADNE